MRWTVVLTLPYLLQCSPTSYGPSGPTYGGSARALPGARRTVRHRVLLRGNTVDEIGARRCHSECRTAPTEEALIECLSDCPGFEVAEGQACRAGDGPPESVCVTVVHGPPGRPEEVDPGVVVLGVIAGTLIVVGTAAACAAGSPASCRAWPTWPQSARGAWQGGVPPGL